MGSEMCIRDRCVAARPLVAGGIGERTEAIAAFPTLDMVLVNPRIEVATPHVFRALTKRDNPPLPPVIGLRRDRLRHWLAGTRNDLEAPARSVASVIGDVLDALDRHGAHFSRMSGSGATCFGLFDSAEEAEAAAARIADAHPGWFVAATRTLHED